VLSGKVILYFVICAVLEMVTLLTPGLYRQSADRWVESSCIIESKSLMSSLRCHRIGQKRPCVITRLCIEDSVESRMVMLQEKKANMINGTINNDQVAMEKLTPEDMQFLFRGS